MVKIMHLDNVAVAQLGNNGRFLLKPFNKLLVIRQVLVDNFNGNLAAQIWIIGAVN